MYQDECGGANCTPLQLCTAGPGGTCAGAIGPDHWEFMDGAACLTPGNTSDSNLVYTGSSTVPTSLTQFASHIHFRRYWACGDWTTLAAGYNSVAGGFVLGGCYYCSVVGSQVSQVLRPGGEGHGILGQGTVYKLNNNWIEGSSIDVFDGGFGSAVPISGYTFLPFTDIEQRRNRETFPYFWLGYNCVANGNACGSIPDTNSYWGGAGDNTPQLLAPVTNVTAGSGPPYTYTVASRLNPGVGNNDVQLSGFKCSGTCTAANGTYSTTASTSSSFQFVSNTAFSSITTYGTGQLVAPVCLPVPTPGATCVNVDSTGLILTYVSGPQFHDSSSSWNSGSKTVLINNDGNKYKISSLGSGSCPASCPTTLTLKSALTVAGAPLSNVPFVFNGNSIVRKNCERDEVGSARGI